MPPPRIALVTGASSGIGEATALRLLRDGFVVYGAARRVEKMAGLVAQGGQALALDVTDEASMEAAVETILAAHGRIDVLVNNAGYGSYGAVEDVPLDEARRQVEVNLFGLARMTQLVLPAMRAQRSGTIVNVSSIGGKIYTPLGAWYHATKHAVEGFSDALRFEVAEFGIRVVIVEPGAISTEFVDVMVEPMMRWSGQGAYARLAGRLKASAEGLIGDDASPPSVIADAISTAARARRPKTRVVAGKRARSALLARTLLSDRAFDALLRSQLK